MHLAAPWLSSDAQISLGGRRPSGCDASHFFLALCSPTSSAIFCLQDRRTLPFFFFAASAACLAWCLAGCFFFNLALCLAFLALSSSLPLLGHSFFFYFPSSTFAFSSWKLPANCGQLAISAMALVLLVRPIMLESKWLQNEITCSHASRPKLDTRFV